MPDLQKTTNFREIMVVCHTSMRLRILCRSRHIKRPGHS